MLRSLGKYFSSIPFLIVLLLAVFIDGAAINGHVARANPCFPLGTARLSGTTPPSQSRDQWWCIKEQYGFMGFSYALENPDCSNDTNSFDKINADFARMKSEFGATMVRIYAPECRKKSIWVNLLQAGIANNMAVLPQVWWGFGDQSLWQQTKASILAVLQDQKLGPVAPYVFHSLAFGSEPIGDNDDGNNFINDLNTMKKDLKPYGIPITISEDWDRPGTMSNGDFTQLGPVGTQIAKAIDLLHVHIMPYYQPDRFPTAAKIWPYFQEYVSFLKNNLPGKPIMISQTLWSSEIGGSHDRGGDNPGEDIGNFIQYWTTIENQCNFFKVNQVAWFVHTYDDGFEHGFGMLDDNGNPKMSFWPPRC